MVEEQLKRIRECAQKADPESARLLIRIYSESEWRSIKLQVIRALGHFSDSRSLPFLVDLVIRNEDLAEQDLALISLARQKSRGARYFLRSFYPNAPESLKPSAAYALGLSQDHSSCERVLADLKIARKGSNLLLLKGLVLAAGELKETRALPEIHELLTRQSEFERDLQLALLFALGRLERDPQKVSAYESWFLDDPILWQVYQSTLSQVQIRSQFKLEDYLSKIFQSDRPHPLTPLELRSFSFSEVQEGVSIFPKNEYAKRHLFCLRAFSGESAARMLEEWVSVGSEWSSFFEAMVECGVEVPDEKVAKRLLEAAGGESASLELRLSWIDAFLPLVDFIKEAPRFLCVSEERLATRFINLWSERAFGETKAEVRKQVRSFLALGLKDSVFSRLIRACVELSLDEPLIEKEWVSRFKSPSSRVALLMYAESFCLPLGLDPVLDLAAEQKKTLSGKILSYLDALASAGKLPSAHRGIIGVLKELSGTDGAGLLGALKVLRCWPDPFFEDLIIQAMSHADPAVRLNAVIAAKSYPKSRELGELLSSFLSSDSEVLRGRALDSILAHSTLLAKRAVLVHLKERIAEEDTVDKVCRDFDPEKRGGEELFLSLESILRAVPEHPQWEKLVLLRDRLRPTSESKDGVPSASDPEVAVLDERLLKVIPGFDKLDLSAKLALRAAEQPFMRAEGAVNLPIDKAPSVLEFCKALDLILEKHLGQKFLFPKLDRELHDFQTHWHRVGFGDEYPQADRVLSLLGLKGKVSMENFPLHKAKQMSLTFFNGKILQDRFKIFDGLRAWAVILLVFGRRITLQGQELGPVLKIPNLSDERVVLLSKRLMQLQDLRNPAAHRQTYPELDSVKGVRGEAIELINWILG